MTVARVVVGAGCDWTSFGSGADAAQASGDTGITVASVPTLKPGWTAMVGGPVGASVTVAKNFAYVADNGVPTSGHTGSRLSVFDAAGASCPARTPAGVQSHRRRAPPWIVSARVPTRRERTVPDFPTVTHVALTVTDLGRSVPWYENLFGAKAVLDEDTGPFRHVVWSVGSTLVGLHQFPDGDSAPFDERRVGLDHVAFACASRAELQQWETRLVELGIANGGIVDAGYGSGLSFRDPDNIALEFFAPPS